MATATDPTKVVTGEVRFSYVHVFQPYSNKPNQDPRYSLLLLIPKSDKKTIAAIRAAQQEALELGKEKHFGGKIPRNWKDTLHDGDEEGDLDQNPEQEGHMYMTVGSSEAYPPGVVDIRRQPIIDRADVYSGCYGRVSINAYAFSNESKGVSFGLRHVMKTRDGEPLGGAVATDPEDDFGAYDGDEESDDSDLLG